MVGTAALTIVLSAFNGLDDLIHSLYESFDPDIEIQSKVGKTIVLDAALYEKIKQTEGVELVSKTIDETCYFKYGDRETIAHIKGVEDNFSDLVNIKKQVVEGEYLLQDGDVSFGVMGYQIAAKLGVYLEDFPKSMKVYAMDRNASMSSLNPENAFQTGVIYPSGIFAINQDFDSKYVIVPFAFAQQLLHYNNEVSAIEIKLKKGAREAPVAKNLALLLGDGYEIKSRNQMNELVFKTNKTEKWITFLILLFILILCTFNLIGSITMIILDKKRDIFTLQSMGLDFIQIKKIFSLTGTYIAIMGAGMGVLLGMLVCFLQIKFKLLKLDGGIVDSYPIKIIFTDQVLIFLTVSVIGFLATLIPVNILLKKAA